MIQPRQIKCSKCGYEWFTKSQLIKVNCPSCRYPNDMNKNERLDK